MGRFDKNISDIAIDSVVIVGIDYRVQRDIVIGKKVMAGGEMYKAIVKCFDSLIVVKLIRGKDYAGIGLCGDGLMLLIDIKGR